MGLPILQYGILPISSRLCVHLEGLCASFEWANVENILTPYLYHCRFHITIHEGQVRKRYFINVV